MRRSGVYLAIAIVVLVLLLLLFGLSRRQIIVPTPTPLPSATATSTNLPSPTAMPTLTETPSTTATATDTDTVEPTATVTDTATEVPPTATATNTQDTRVIVQVVAQIAVFRTGPGRVYLTVTQVKMGNKILLSGISEDRAWYMFIYSNKNTWISADKLVTEVIFGDVNTLPVIDAPPTPLPRATLDSNADDGGYNASLCDFYNGMTVEGQNSLLQQVYSAVDAGDWHQAGALARHLYNCPSKPVFYLLYNVYLPMNTAPGKQVADSQSAYAMFLQGWLGQ